MKRFLLFALTIISISVSSQNQNISKGNIFDGEPFIAINPTNSQHLVVAWMGLVLGKRVQIKTSISTNGGQTWSSATKISHVVTGYTSADPSLAFDKNGNVYLSFIDFTGFDANPIEGAVYISKSSDNGTTWNTPVEVIHTNDDPGKRNIDRPWMVIDKSNSATQGNIYITTMNAKGSTASYNPYFSVSTDGGNNFTWRYLDTANYLAGSLISQPMPTPAISTTGSVYAVYPSYVISQNLKAQFIVASSTNAGNSFTYNTVLASNTGVSDPLPKKGYLLKTNPINPDNLVFFYLFNSGNNIDIMMRESIDNGINWGNGIKVNDDNGTAMQDLVWADFDTDGDLIVSWRDRRNGTGADYTTDSEIWAVVRWKDSTNFSTNFRISDTLVDYDNILANSGNDFMCIEFLNDTLNAVWGDTRTGKLNIWFSRMDAKGNIVSVKKIASENQPQIMLFPNPAHNTVSITGNSITAISIFNSTGKQVYSNEFSSITETETIDISNLAVGVYWIIAKTKDGELTKKLVKN